MTDAGVIAVDAAIAAEKPAAQQRRWLGFALGVMLLWGVWGAATGVSIARGFPETLIYVVWSLTMIVPTVVVLARVGWRVDASAGAIALGLLIGLTGAGGQLLLFHAVKSGPAYLIFPIISLSPVVTIAMSIAILRERTGLLGWTGIALALVALPLLDFAPGGTGEHGGWFWLALLVMAAWGVQAFAMKFANTRMSGESIFAWMTLSGLLLAPVAWAMTDWSQPVNWGWDGPWLAAGIQLLNAIGALLLVFAFRYGKAIVVAPLTNAGAPLTTALIALAAAGVVPGPLKTVALMLALVAAALLALTAERDG